MILGLSTRPETASQVPSAAREPSSQKPRFTMPPPPAWMAPPPAEKEPAAQPSWSSRMTTQVMDKARENSKPVLLEPKTKPAAPQGWLAKTAAQAMDKLGENSRPVLLGSGKPLPEEPIGKGRGRDLTGFSYTVSGQELERLRRANPDASAEVPDDKDRAIPLTWKEYDKLSFDQKAAVDFNTLLIDAREKDLLYNDPSQYTKTNIDAYNKDVAGIFGEGGGSDKKAFNVVKLLKSVNFKAIGQDLDEFLSLDRAIDVNELKDFKFSREDVAALEEFNMKGLGGAESGIRYARGTGGRGPAELPPPPSTQSRSLAESSDESRAYANVRTDENLAAIDTTLIRNTLKEYKKRLEQGGPNLWDIKTAFDGTAFTPSNVIPVGYGRRGLDDKGKNAADYDTSIQTAFGILAANPNKQGMKALEDYFTQWEYTDEDKSALWKYMNDRTLRDSQYSGAEYVKPLRQFLGWE